MGSVACTYNTETCRLQRDLLVSGIRQGTYLVPSSIPEERDHVSKAPISIYGDATETYSPA